MPLQNFTDNQLPTVKAAWLNLIDVFYNTAISSAGASTIGGVAQVVDSISGLKALLKTSVSKRAFVLGYYAAGDGGGGSYWCDLTDTTSSDNNGTIIVAVDGGRWKLANIDNISIRQFGVNPSQADNSTALASVVAWLGTFSATATMPRIIIPSGIYPYATSPNWGIQGLSVLAEVGAIFKHTGTGIAFNVDGGSVGGGVYRIRFEGGLRIQGNINSTYGLYNRAVHHSFFDISVRDVATAALYTAWCVCNGYRFSITPLGDPAFIVTPANGIFLDKRGIGELTSDCTFYDPIAEGITAGYGINLANSVQCTFLGGTSESNSGGVFISNTSKWNKFINLDMEANATADIFSQGLYNIFDNCLSTTTSTFASTSDLILAGNYNAISNSGTDNEFIKTRYAINAGTFTDTGTGTIKRSVRNVTSGTLDVELDRNPHQLVYINGPASNNTVIGSADQLVGGGSANNLLYYHYGSGEQQIWVAGLKQLSIGANTMGFYGTAAAAKPAITGAKGGNAALGSLLTALAGLGLITDNTTA